MTGPMDGGHAVLAVSLDGRKGPHPLAADLQQPTMIYNGLRKDIAEDGRKDIGTTQDCWWNC